jgi:hypothetical protein
MAVTEAKPPEAEAMGFISSYGSRNYHGFHNWKETPPSMEFSYAAMKHLKQTLLSQ